MAESKIEFVARGRRIVEFSSRAQANDIIDAIGERSRSDRSIQVTRSKQ
jgi:hypothetical protein